MSELNFISPPLEHISGIPVYSHRDSYVRNYERISRDHLSALGNNRGSPFMVQSQIDESEAELKALIRRQLTPGAMILDAGIGLGGLVAGLRDYNCYGVDISIPYLEVASRQCSGVVMAKLEELPYADSTFDAVLACDVLEHVFRLDLAVEQLLRVLKPSGVLIVRVPNEESLAMYLSDSHPYDHSHVRSFSLASLRLYFEQCFGLCYVDHSFIGYLFNSSDQLLYPSPMALSGSIAVFDQLLSTRLPRKAKKILRSLRLNHSLSLEQQADALILIRDSYPDVFCRLAPELLRPVEVVAAFRKP